MELVGKMENLSCFPRDTKRKGCEINFLWSPDLQKTDNIGLLSNNGELVSGYTLLTLGNFASGFPRYEQEMTQVRLIL